MRAAERQKQLQMAPGGSLFDADQMAANAKARAEESARAASLPRRDGPEPFPFDDTKPVEQELGYCAVFPDALDGEDPWLELDGAAEEVERRRQQENLRPASPPQRVAARRAPPTPAAPSQAPAFTTGLEVLKRRWARLRATPAALEDVPADRRYSCTRPSKAWRASRFAAAAGIAPLRPRCAPSACGGTSSRARRRRSAFTGRPATQEQIKTGKARLSISRCTSSSPQSSADATARRRVSRRSGRCPRRRPRPRLVTIGRASSI